MHAYSQSNIMNKSNLSSEENSRCDLSLEDLPKMDIGYLNFLNLYTQACDEKLTNAQKVDAAKRQWAELTEEQRMQFVLVKSDASLSVKSEPVSDGKLLEGFAPTADAIGGSAFNNFMESYTIKLSQQAAKKWASMTKGQRAAYAAKDDDSSPSGSSSLDCVNGQEPQPPQLVNYMFRNIGKESCCKKPKPRCPKPKPRCPKPKPRCCKPKPRCAKPKPRCAKPKPRCRKPKPRCRKPKPRCPMPKCPMPKCPMV